MSMPCPHATQPTKRTKKWANNSFSNTYQVNSGRSMHIASGAAVNSSNFSTSVSPAMRARGTNSNHAQAENAQKKKFLKDEQR